MNDVEVNLEKISKILKKTIDFFWGGVILLSRSQQKVLKGGDIHRSLKGDGRFLS